ncbi:MAG: CHAT domain-containing protein [Cyclobacteriaceae bacterium]
MIVTKYLFLLIILLAIGNYTAYSQTVSADSTKAAEIYSEGMKLLKVRKYEAAIEKFKTALQLFTEKNDIAYTQTLIRIGNVYAVIPDTDRAIEYFDKAAPYAESVKEKYGEYKTIVNLHMQLAYTLLDDRKLEQALPHFMKVSDLILEDSTSLTPMQKAGQLAYTYGAIGNIYAKNGEFDKGAVYLNKALQQAEKTKNKDGLISAFARNSNYYLELGNIQKAKDLFDEVVSLSLEKYDANAIEMAVVYGLRGRLEQADEEFEKAIGWAEKALRIHQQNPTIELRHYAYNLYSLSVTENNMGDYQEALDHINKSLEIYKTINVTNSSLLPELGEKLRILTYLKRFDGAGKVLQTIESVIEEADPVILVKTNLLLSKAIYLREIRHFEEAESVYLDIINLLITDFANKKSPLANAYYEYSIQAYRQGDPQKALTLIDSALSNNIATIEWNSQKVERIISGQNHVAFLRHKSTIIQSGDNLDSLKKALSMLEDGLAYISDKKATSVGTKFGMDATTSLRDKALEICYELFDITGEDLYFTKAFQYGEMAKSQQLKEWIYQSYNRQELANEQSKRKYEIEQQIITYQNLIVAASDKKNEGIAHRNRFLDSLSVFQERYDELVESMKTSDPDYYRAMYKNLTFTDQKEIYTAEENEQLIAYQLTDSSLFVLITGREKHLLKLPLASLQEQILQYREDLKNPDSESYQRTGRILYEKLILPLEAYLYAENLIIIPDGVLAYLPFELLISANGQLLSDSKLIRYQYTVSRDESTENTTISEKMIAFAPECIGEDTPAKQDVVRSGLARLSGAFEEVNIIETIYEGDYYKKQMATEGIFKQNAHQYKLIHLATHAVVDDQLPERSKLVFSASSANDTLNDGYLHAYEIYHMDLNAQLVTLSACNTGYGQIRKGEGVMSLSRAFAYAGVPSTLVSLWPASDKSTPQLMKLFYENLKDGQNKSKALANAKKQYLQTARGKAKHPFYWGGFVVIGDDTAIDSQNDWTTWLILAILFSLLVLYFIGKSRSRKK